MKGHKHPKACARIHAYAYTHSSHAYACSLHAHAYTSMCTQLRSKNYVRKKYLH